MQDSNSTNDVALADILNNIDSAPMEHLELALPIIRALKINTHPVMGHVWDEWTARIEAEIVERTLLKECTTSNTTQSKS